MKLLKKENMKLKDSQIFVANLSTHFHTNEIDADALTIAQALIQLSGQYTVLQERECNRELTNSERNREKKIETQLKELSKLCKLPLKLGGDPRGYTVKCFFSDGSYNTWGGAEEGFGIPTSIND